MGGHIDRKTIGIEGVSFFPFRNTFYADRKTIGIEGVSEWKERNLKRDLR